MLKMLELVGPPPHARVLDLGGTEFNWSLVAHSFHVTLLNLPGARDMNVSDLNRYTVLEADACNLLDVFEDNAFDFIFSNSVIEHVGDEYQQGLFAEEVRRLAPAYWVQTPSDKFPVEAHTGVLYWWRRSEDTRERMRSRWRKKLPRWTESIESVRVLSRRRMQELFPEADVFVEKVFGFEKSYAMYRACPSALRR